MFARVRIVPYQSAQRDVGKKVLLGEIVRLALLAAISRRATFTSRSGQRNRSNGRDSKAEVASIQRDGPRVYFKLAREGYSS